ncbi:MAG: cytochrome c-type biogenesis protein CcmH [Chloroflexi bacterium]|nr:cytochrome c-type biogenesis protein CcmH [Chloroflexota bacterium]MCL5075312.1 cytochrome c-type biogenesis protein CcmH [Chloroflexota bacterium]
MIKGIVSILLAVLLSLLTVSTAWADQRVDEIARQLMCQCGCTMVLSTCDCSTAQQFREEIQTKLGQGQTPGQIIQSFMERYGEKALAAPTKTGFNLTAWATPFMAILGGGLALYLLVRVWVRKDRPSPVLESSIDEREKDEYEERLQKELDQF